MINRKNLKFKSMKFVLYEEHNLVFTLKYHKLI